jgi:hypothetical protein
MLPMIEHLDTDSKRLGDVEGDSLEVQTADKITYHRRCDELISEQARSSRGIMHSSTGDQTSEPRINWRYRLAVPGRIAAAGLFVMFAATLWSQQAASAQTTEDPD